MVPALKSTKAHATLGGVSSLVSNKPPAPLVSSKDTNLAATAPVGATTSATSPAAHEDGSFSRTFWEKIFAATGYRQDTLESMRSTASPLRDVSDAWFEPQSVSTSSSERKDAWADPVAVSNLRQQLQQYVDALRLLKVENEKQLKTRPFVEQKRYEALRSRECSSRITAQQVLEWFETLVFAESELTVLDSGLRNFRNLKTLNVSRNMITRLDRQADCAESILPESLEVFIASGNAIGDVDLDVFTGLSNLRVVGLSNNAISSTAFLLSCAATVVAVDLSYCPIANLDEVIETVSVLPQLKFLNFVGCPVTLAPAYRERILASCRLLRSLDGVATGSPSDTGNSPPETPDAAPVVAAQLVSPRGATNSKSQPALVVAPPPQTAAPASPRDTAAVSNSCTITVSIVGVKGAMGLAPVEDIQAQRAASAGGAKGKAPAPGGKKSAAGGKAVVAEVEERVPFTQPTLSLSGEWCDGAVTVRVEDLDAVPASLLSAAADDSAAKLKPAAKKAPAGGAAAAEVPVNPAIPIADQEVPVRRTIHNALPLVSTSDEDAVLASRWLRAMRSPLVVYLDYNEYTMLPASSVSPPATNAVSPPPSKSLNVSYWLGGFVVPIYDILVDIVAAQRSQQKKRSPANVHIETVTVPLKVQEDTLAKAAATLAKKRQTLADMVKHDSELDAALQDMIAAETHAAEAAAASAAAAAATISASPAAKGAKGGAHPSAKQAVATTSATKQYSEAVISRQAESAQRKILIEETVNSIKDDERRHERIRGQCRKLFLTLQVALNAPADALVSPIEGSSPTASAAAAASASPPPKKK